MSAYVPDVLLDERRDKDLDEAVEEGLWQALAAAPLSVGVLGGEDLGLAGLDVERPAR